VPDYAKISQHLVQFLPEGGSKPSSGTFGNGAGNGSGNGSMGTIGGIVSVQNIALILVLAAVVVIVQVNGWLF
jgi:hypothetical protein